MPPTNLTFIDNMQSKMSAILFMPQWGDERHYKTMLVWLGGEGCLFTNPDANWWLFQNRKHTSLVSYYAVTWNSYFMNLFSNCLHTLSFTLHSLHEWVFRKKKSYVLTIRRYKFFVRPVSWEIKACACWQVLHWRSSVILFCHILLSIISKT